MLHSAQASRGWQKYWALLGLVGLAAAVLGYWAVSERTRTTHRAELAGNPALQLIPDRSLPDPRHRSLDEVAIELALPGLPRRVFTLQRRQDGQRSVFYMTPPGHRADDAEVESLLDALLSTVATRSLAAADDSTFGAYGLTEAQCRVRVRFGAGHALCFGADSPSGAVYVRADQAPVILVVERAVFELLGRPPLQYRARRLVLQSLLGAHHFALGPLQLSHDGDLWRVRLADGRWALAEPSLMTELLQNLTTLPVSSWPPVQPLAALGPPPLTITIDGQELLRGGWPCPQDPTPQAQLFVRSDGELVCARSPSGGWSLPRWAELRAQSLLPVPLAQLTRLQVAPGVDVVRQTNGTYTQLGQPADPESVRRLLEPLTLGQELIATAAPPPRDAVRAVITTGLGQRVTLQLWRSGSRTLVQRDEEPAQQLTDPDAVAALFSLGPLSLAPLQLLSLEPAAVRRISRRGAVTEELERTAGWHLRAPTQAPADSAAVESLLAVLTDLRATRWVSEQSRPEFGLEPPRLRLAITLGAATKKDSVAAAEPSLGGKLGAAAKKDSVGTAEPSFGGGLGTAAKKDSVAAAETALGMELGASAKKDSVAAAETALGMELGGAASVSGDCYARRHPGAAVAVLPAATCATLEQPLLSPLLLRLDEDRLTALRVTRGLDATAAVSCTRPSGPWQCSGQTLAPTTRRALFAALYTLQHGERPTYADAPTTPPRLTLHLTHAPLGPTLRRTNVGTEVAVGAEVAAAEQTLRLYTDPRGGWLARLAQRDVTYHLPDSAITALQAALPVTP